MVTFWLHLDYFSSFWLIEKYNLIQGTKWCGVDDKADNYNDLGKYERLDKSQNIPRINEKLWVIEIKCLLN
jgi:hypothetical protein